MKIDAPMYYEDNITYFRSEENGKYSLMIKTHSEAGFIAINKTTKFIIDNCNGENTFENLCDLVEERFKVSHDDNVRNDVEVALLMLWRLGVIYFESENNFLNKKFECSIGDYKIKYLQNEAALNFFDDIEKDELTPYVDFEMECNPTAINSNWFISRESYFEIYSGNNECICKFSIRPDLLLNCFALSSLKYNQHVLQNYGILEKGLEFAASVYLDVLKVQFEKRPVFILYSFVEMKKFPFFAYRGMLKHEIENRDVFLYSTETF